MKKKSKKMFRNLTVISCIVLFCLASCLRKIDDGTGSENSNHTVPEQPEIPEIPSAEEACHWWPVQKEPKSVVVCEYKQNLPEHALAQSLAGLAALGVNEGRFDEMVWMSRGDADSKLWYERMMAEKKYGHSGTFTTWKLLERYVERGLIKGYVLFRSYSKGSESLNPATVLASLNQAVLIEEELENQAKNLGLVKVADAIGMSSESVFDDYKDELDDSLLITIDPNLANLRDFAIANKSMCIYGTGSFEKKVFEWLKPFSPIFGYNKGDEFAKTALATYYGHFVVPSSLSFNLPVLSAGSEKVEIKKIPEFDPKSIQYDDDFSYHSFIMTDGDNFRYTTTNFFFNQEYWGNRYNKEIPVSWSMCPINMAMGIPYAWNEIVSNTDKPILFEYGPGGYYYPDLFANSRENREELRREFARMLNAHFKKMGVKVFGFICKERKSVSAMRAYEIFAEEIEGLVGMLAVQYNPYEDGKGEIMWVKNKNGVEIPVLCPKYSLWANVNSQYKGNPDEISSYINRDLMTGQNFNATMVHAWSHYVKKPDGSVSDANNTDAGAVAGVEPVQWTKEKLNENVKIVPLEELLWRIRMEYREEDTKKILGMN